MYFFVNFLIIMTAYVEFTSSNSIIRSDGDHWSYDGEDGPDSWPGVCTIGSRQSPIDIGVAKEPLHGPPLKLKDGFWEDVSWNSSWNGHTFVAQMKNPENSGTLLDGSLDSTYVFHSLHLHWGSEHTILDIRFTGEMHLVHYNKKYSYQDALKQPDGLAVIGIFLQESNYNVNEPFSEFIEAMTEESDDSDESIGKFRFATFLRKSLEPWVRYEGSLTTPTCTENVKWTVLLEPISIRKGLIQHLHKPNSNTYRPIQDINNRTVYIQREINGSPTLSHSFKLLIINLLLGTIIKNIPQIIM